MPVTNYYSVGGEILGEETGGVRRDYLTDALGSVTGTVTSAGAIENTYRYKPYGAQLSKTGSAADPAFTWVGKWGYRQTNKNYSDVYVRARHYSSVLGKWATPDPLGYRDGIVLDMFVKNNIVNYIDYNGMLTGCCCCINNVKLRAEVFDIVQSLGHRIYVDIDMYYKKTINDERPGNCMLEWKELWDREPPSSPPQDFVDQWSKYGCIITTFHPWCDFLDSRKSCPALYTAQIIDTAEIPRYSKIKYVRHLCQKITIRSAPKCHCPKKAVTVTGIQTLSLDSGESKPLPDYKTLYDVGKCKKR